MRGKIRDIVAEAISWALGWNGVSQFKQTPSGADERAADEIMGLIGWHDSSVELPVQGVTVLVTLQDEWVRFGMWDGRQWDLEHSELDHEIPVKWMYIPE